VFATDSASGVNPLSIPVGLAIPTKLLGFAAESVAPVLNFSFELSIWVLESAKEQCQAPVGRPSILEREVPEYTFTVPRTTQHLSASPSGCSELIIQRQERSAG
jgi:hypothetical protein